MREAMKRYFLFGGEIHYPRGGWRDFVGSYDSMEEAMARARSTDERGVGLSHCNFWWHIIDSTTWEEVDHKDRGFGGIWGEPSRIGISRQPNGGEAE
jgi:hypothetical protein